MNFSSASQGLTSPNPQPDDKRLRMQLHYCDFCQQSTLHFRQAEDQEATPAEASSSVISEGELLQCSCCEAYTLG